LGFPNCRGLIINAIDKEGYGQQLRASRRSHHHAFLR
ncbi:hypothetical protein CUMW_149640, partial [Citrus unshiu]